MTQVSDVLKQSGDDGAVLLLYLAGELSVADEQWPLPKYREMLFPV